MLYYLIMTHLIFKISWAISSDRPSVDRITEAFSDNIYGHSNPFFNQAIEGGRLLIAYADGKPAGYLIYQMIWGNTPYLALIRVMPDQQQKGLGRQLVQRFEEKLKKEGFSAYISSSESDNEGSHVFHKKMGFRPIGTLDMIFGKEDFFKKEI